VGYLIFCVAGMLTSEQLDPSEKEWVFVALLLYKCLSNVTAQGVRDYELVVF
jgi:hypothetical protein